MYSLDREGGRLDTLQTVHVLYWWKLGALFSPRVGSRVTICTGPLETRKGRFTKAVDSYKSHVTSLLQAFGHRPPV